MDRRTFFAFVGSLAGSTCAGALVGCRGRQFGHVIERDQPDLVGSHAAGAEVFSPLIEEAVAKLLERQSTVVQEVTYQGAEVLPTPKSICFVGVENKSIEELGDFKDQIYQQIDTLLVQSQVFQPVSKRVMDAALRETRLRPDSLLIPDNMRIFASVLEQQGQPLHYLLYATLTSGTTERNQSEQRDYLLTLEMVNVQTGAYDKQSAEISKGYHKTRAGKIWHYNPLKSAG
ncbi:MAG: penicillin-binding protein activator LpoB [Pirellulaceae bacterium]